MTCRCGHGRHHHRRASGVKRLPCQALVRTEKPGWAAGTMSVAARMITTKCKCRDWVPAEVRP